MLVDFMLLLQTWWNYNKRHPCWMKKPHIGIRDRHMPTHPFSHFTKAGNFPKWMEACWQHQYRLYKARSRLVSLARCSWKLLKLSHCKTSRKSYSKFRAVVRRISARDYHIPAGYAEHITVFFLKMYDKPMSWPPIVVCGGLRQCKGFT